jgi:hypothetical protein
MKGRCIGCGKIIPLHSKYCKDCVKLHHRFKSEGIPMEVQMAFWAFLRKYGYICQLSGVSLVIDDDTSPWYLVFSRVVPGYDSKIVPAAALFNDMKTAFTEKGFKSFVLALDDNHRKHLKIKARPVVHWRPRLSPGEKACPVCGQAVISKMQKYCPRCAGIVHRMKHARFSPACIKAVLDYLHKYGFVCYYTGMPLVWDDTKSPWYLVFDHWMPRDPRKIVVTSAVLNAVKGDLTEKEFWYFIRQLANYYRHGTPVKKIKLACWCRTYTAESPMGRLLNFRPAANNLDLSVIMNLITTRS